MKKSEGVEEGEPPAGSIHMRREALWEAFYLARAGNEAAELERHIDEH